MLYIFVHHVFCDAELLSDDLIIPILVVQIRDSFH